MSRIPTDEELAAKFDLQPTAVQAYVCRSCHKTRPAHAFKLSRGRRSPRCRYCKDIKVVHVASPFVLNRIVK